MSSNFQVEFKKNNGNLHVSPSGDFDGSAAWELINLLHEHYDGEGRVYIETTNLRQLCPFGCTTFQCRLNRQQLPVERLFFKGEKGADIAPKGSTVIRSLPKHRCRGNCANCTCCQSKKKY
ncbi:hypothetical protein [uncultured Desulfosarcina sp.]|uniref:hypothetical protein n=1 Tax=uncultured Desulfosarcina sp. TaxID=218289 RepID=UPI0029C669D4|nr:hypothetical protein [uncultured Desulfosarcina sp.]